MNFSLLTVCATHPDGTVDGYWVQDCAGVTLAEAQERAAKYNARNSRFEGASPVKVVEQIRCPVPALTYWTYRRVAS